MKPQILTSFIEDVIQEGAEPFPVMYFSLYILIPEFGGFGNGASNHHTPPSTPKILHPCVEGFMTEKRGKMFLLWDLPLPAPSFWDRGMLGMGIQACENPQLFPPLLSFSSFRKGLSCSW